MTIQELNIPLITHREHKGLSFGEEELKYIYRIYWEYTFSYKMKENNKYETYYTASIIEELEKALKNIEHAYRGT